MRAGECPKQNYFPSTTVPRADTTSLEAASLHAACMAYAPCPGRGGYVTGGGEGENDGVRSHVCFQKAGAMAGEAEGCRTAAGNNFLCLRESSASALQAPLHWDGKHVQRVINAPKEALLMKKIRGRVAYILWDVYPTQR